METLPADHVIRFATTVHDRVLAAVSEGVRAAYYGAQNPPELRTVIVSGVGEFLARRAVERTLGGAPIERVVSLNDELGPDVSACAPAYALAVLAAEKR